MMKQKSTINKATGKSSRTATTRPRKAASPLSKESIVAAALAMIDREGLESFSIRGLAKSLGVYPTAVTWYLASKREILAEVVELVTSDLSPAQFYDSWQEYLRLVFRKFRNAIRRHPNMAQLMGTHLVANPAVDLELVERMLSALSHAGFRGTKLAAAYNTAIVSMVGFATQEFGPIPEEGTEIWREDIRARLKSVTVESFPILAQHMSLLQNKAFIVRWQNGTNAPLDPSFEFFVDTVIGGLEVMLKTR
jgi:TetR/AcrR family transcriptional regulator, tetracycline repressor protein